jgi:germacradienol/geosmin synthase
MVLVVQRFLDLDKAQAAQAVNELMTARMRQFEHIVKTELPALADDFKLDSHTQERLHAYVEKLQQWMAGVLRWHQTVDRYKEFELINSRYAGRTFSAPKGLGTSAARIASLFTRP